MSKIVYRSTAEAKDSEDKPLTDVDKSTAVEATTADAESTFDKEKIIKTFKRHPHRKIKERVERFTPDVKNGLTNEQVETRFRQFLFNDTNKKYSKTYLAIFLENICTFFNMLCLIAGIALFLAGVTNPASYSVLLITTINIAIGIFQEIRAKLAIDKLSILASSSIKAIRDGEVVQIPTTEVVLDDIISLELGNQVPADCILLEGNVEVNESLLTGESIAIKKQVGDLLYAGSFIASGSGKFHVDKVGKETYLNKLSSKAKQYKRPNSELMNSTKLIIKIISLIIIPIAVGMFLITKKFGGGNVEYAPFFSPDISYAIQRTCAVVIGMIPCGMILLTSIALYTGVARLSKNHTLVQDLYSLEMLARVNVLCLDKTGTITDGRMKVHDVVILNTIADYSVNDIMGSMLTALDDNNQTAIALYNHFGHSDTLKAIAKIPFSSKRKLSAVSFEGVGTFAMGAPEFVLNPLPVKVEKIVKQYAQMGLRVIVLAHSTTNIAGDKLPSVMKPIAIISIADNIREDAISTIQWFKDNDVQVKVISGDNPITVAEVAKRAGIVNAEKFISLEGLNDREVENVANKYTVFGRVSPEQKAILIRSIKSEGNTVAMTGDGVNDILALKEADCAISVASGSEAARNVSHLVLMDNNFNSMPKIVAEGRRVINNIKNSSSLYLMKTFFTTLLALLCIGVFKCPYLFSTENLLLLEMFVIGVPSFFLSLQPNNARVEGKYISFVLNRSIPGALLMTIAVIAVWLTGNIFAPQIYAGYWQPMCTIVLTFAGLIMLFRVCQPFNAYRVVLFAVVLALSILAFAVPQIAQFIYTDWNSLHWEYPMILTMLVILEAMFPLSATLLSIMNVLLPTQATNSVKKKSK